MAKTRKLIVDVIADASKFTSELNKADGYTKRLKGSMKNLGKSLAIGAAAGGAAAVTFGAGAIKAAEEAEQVQKRVGAIIKATGGSAGVTAKQIDKFASTQQGLVGVDDEVLKKSYGILLTFKNVRNEAGKGNDIFNRTAKSLADLSAAGFGSTDSAAKAMGKALQDPVKGITALSRAGVTFTQAQKDQIKGFVESGDLLSAQKVILGEVEGQVGGTAAAGVTASEKMKIAFGELQEKIGKKLLPVFEKVSDWIMKKGLKAVEKFFKWAEENTPIIIALASAVGVLAAAIGIANAVMWLLSLNPVVMWVILITAGVVALAAILVILYNKFDSVKNVVDTVGQVLGIVVQGIWTGIKWYFALAKKEIEILAEVFTWLWETLKPVGEALIDIFSGVFNGIKAVLRFEWNALVAIVNPILKLLNKIPQLSWLPDELPRWPDDQGSSSRKPYMSGGVRRMGEGGLVTRATDVTVGERGPEAIIPLDQLGFGQPTGTTNITINVQASPLANPSDVGAAVVDALKAYERRNGSLKLKIA